MDTKDIIMVLGILGAFISAFFFMSPYWTTIRRILQLKSTAGYSYVQYVCTLLSTTLWTYYGYITGQYFVFGINGFGLLAHLYYVYIFLSYGAIHSQAICVVVAVNLGIPVTAIVPSVVLGAEKSSVWLGPICAVLTGLMYLSSLNTAINAWKTKSVEFMSFWVLLFSFINAVTWGFYGFLQGDLSIMGANGVGFVIGLVQLIIFFYIKNTRNEEDVPTLQ